MIAFVYWIDYCLIAFWGERETVTYVKGNALSRPEDISLSLLLVFLSIGCLWIGMRAGRKYRFFSPGFLSLSHDPTTMSYLQFIMLLGCLWSIAEASPYLLGVGGRQLFIIALNSVPLVIFAIFFRSFVRREASGYTKFLIALFIILRFVSGMSSGWLGSFGSVVIISAAVYIAERKKLPGLWIAFIVAFVLFFQAGKSTFRDQYWGSESGDSLTERIEYWFSASLERWSAAFSGEGPASQELSREVLRRFDLLNLTALIVRMTPSVVPYQHFSLYSYMSVTWVPRFLWPGKPSMNEANSFIQLRYGVTPESNINNVAISVGVAAESYVSFGWLGPFIVILPLGFLLGLFETAFLSRDCGLLLKCIGIGMIPTLVAVESQMAQYLGGFVQTIALTILILLPAARADRLATTARAKKGQPGQLQIRS